VVVTISTVEPVVPVASVKMIVAGAAVEEIGTCPSFNVVVIPFPEHRIVAATCPNRVVSISPQNYIALVIV
jgi:hypothetical protein